MEMSEVRPGPEVPLSLIALLREQTRCRRDELDPNQLGHTGPFSSWQEALTRVARETGLVAESVPLSAREVCALARGDAPLVHWTAETGWVVVTADARGRACLTAPPVPSARVEPTDVVRRLGLASEDARKAELMELKLFGGLSFAELSEVTGLSTSTLDREIRFARAWMTSRMAGQE